MITRNFGAVAGADIDSHSRIFVLPYFAAVACACLHLSNSWCSRAASLLCRHIALSPDDLFHLPDNRGAFVPLNILSSMCGIDVTLSVCTNRSTSSADATTSNAASLLVRRRGPDAVSEHVVRGEGFELRLAGAVLALRGQKVVAQPLVDADGNALLWNGEIFGGDVLVPPGVSDTEQLSAALALAPSIPELMRRVHGPWAFVYWHASSRTLWHGRDPLGRRSLLRADHHPVAEGDGTSRVLSLSSVATMAEDGAPPALLSDGEVAWEELPANGIGSLSLLEGCGIEFHWHPHMPMPPPLPLHSLLLSAHSQLGHGPSVAGVAGVAGEEDEEECMKAAASWEDSAVRDGQAAAARFLLTLSDAVKRRVCGVPPPPASTSASPLASSLCSPEEDGATGGAISALPTPCATSSARVAVLFSGGIDCMVLARLADLHMPPDQPIDLINVAFGALASEAPDRLTGREGVRELRALSARRFNLIEVNVSLDELQQSRRHLLAVLRPASTVMDLNIGAALWYGSRGRGMLCGGGESSDGNGGGGDSSSHHHQESCTSSRASAVCRYAGQSEHGADGIVSLVAASAAVARPRVLLRVAVCGRAEIAPGNEVHLTLTHAGSDEQALARDGSPMRSPHGEPQQPQPPQQLQPPQPQQHYQSGARVLLLGTGADEQLAGYGRHRTVFRKEGWAGLSSELAAERERLWLRNLGRDDRVISDWGREARHPYLDEEVMRCLAATPLHHICDLRRPLGEGDKLILRRAARILGLGRSSALQKRAIQFGTRIANKNVCGQAVLDDSIDLSEVVHPDAAGNTAGGAVAHAKAAKGAASAVGVRVAAGSSSRRGDSALPASLSKKRGVWASARAAPAALQDDGA